MAEQKLISTSTISTGNSTSFEIYTFYDQLLSCDGESFESLPNVLKVFLTEEVGVKDGIVHIEGQLIIAVKNYGSQIAFFINNQGHFIISTTTNDVNRYSIDSNGHLIYDNCIPLYFFTRS